MCSTYSFLLFLSISISIYLSLYLCLSISISQFISPFLCARMQVRGNHMHLTFPEVITFIHGRFHVRLSRPLPSHSTLTPHSGEWETEDILIEVDSSLASRSSPLSVYDYLPAYTFVPFRRATSSTSSIASSGMILSSSPISMRVPPRVCHAIRTPNTTDAPPVSFFSSYYVKNPFETEETPDRGICRSERRAYLDSSDSLFDFPMRLDQL
jgi:hypothetical protein